MSDDFHLASGFFNFMLLHVFAIYSSILLHNISSYQYTIFSQDAFCIIKSMNFRQIFGPMDKIHQLTQI